MTFNIEGAKTNINYLKDLAKDPTLIICLQEHWLWGFEKDFLQKHFPLHSFFIRSKDENDPILNFKAPRGHAGTAIMWPQSLDNCIQKLSDGNDRIMAIKIELKNQNICLINTYMPTTSANSEVKYKEFLDIITHINENYTDFTTILCGDLNGTLKTSRSNQHDKILQRFTSTQNWINKCHSQDAIFFHHNGRSTSQIDYFLTKNIDIIDKITIMDMTGINLSTHVPVICALAARTKTEKNQFKKQSTVKYKIEWDRGNINMYKTKLKELLAQQISIHNNQTTTDIVAIIIDCLKKAEKQSIPSRIIKLKGNFAKKSKIDIMFILYKNAQIHRY